MTTRYTVIVFIDGFLDEPAVGNDWSARPLVTTDQRWRAAIEAWATSQGAQSGSWQQDAVSTVPSDVVAVQSSADAKDADSAIAAVRDRLLAVSRAIAFRQLLPLRVLTWVALDPTTGRVEARRDVADPPKVYHRGAAADGWTAGAHVESLIELMTAAPEADLFVTLLAEAIGHSAEIRLILLWSLLEVLSDGFRPRGQKRSPGDRRPGKLAQVEDALAFLGLQGQARLDAAYALRNQIIHEGRRVDAVRAESLASGLVKVTARALQASGFRPIDRSRPAMAPPDAWPIETHIARASARRPW
jgi:hypothetical protein